MRRDRKVHLQGSRSGHGFWEVIVWGIGQLLRQVQRNLDIVNSRKSTAAGEQLLLVSSL